MEELAPQTYCQRASLELAALIRHQRRPRGRLRRDSTLLRRFIAEVLGTETPVADLQEGPWQVTTKPLKKPGRGGLGFIPQVQRGETVIMVNTPREAEELAAFLNLCAMEEFSSH